MVNKVNEVKDATETCKSPRTQWRKKLERNSNHLNASSLSCWSRATRCASSSFSTVDATTVTTATFSTNCDCLCCCCASEFWNGSEEACFPAWGCATLVNANALVTCVLCLYSSTSWVTPLREIRWSFVSFFGATTFALLETTASSRVELCCATSWTDEKTESCADSHLTLQNTPRLCAQNCSFSRHAQLSSTDFQTFLRCRHLVWEKHGTQN